MKRISSAATATCVLLLITGCYTSKQGYETPAPQGVQQPGQDQPVDQNDPRNTTSPSTIAAQDDAHVAIGFEKASFAAYAIDLDNLFYELDFVDDAGNSILKINRTPLEFDPATKKGQIKAKVKKGSTGIISLKVEDNTDANDKFAGKSDRVTINDDSPVAIALKKIGDASVTINVSFGDDIDTDDQDNDQDNTDNDQDNQDDGLASLPANLQAKVRSLGDPKAWNEPNLEQIQGIAEEYCTSCHPSSAPGNAAAEDFYSEKRITEYMNNKRMPYPGTNDANDLNKMADAGFDYRDAMVKFARSLGNNR